MGLDILSQSNNKYLQTMIAKMSNMSPNQVIGSLSTGIDRVAPSFFPPDKEPQVVRPMEIASQQQMQVITQAVKQKDEEHKEAQAQGRLAMAIADAMRQERDPVVVGKVKPSGEVVGEELPPETVPEPRETIQANIDAVGKGGRTGVFSEVPFEAEDVPEGWDVVESSKGGWWTAPSDNIEDVMYNDSIGDFHVPLGFAGAKPEQSDGTVVQAIDEKGRVASEEVVDQAGSEHFEEAKARASERGTPLVSNVDKILQERVAKVNDQKFTDFLTELPTLEGDKKLAYDDNPSNLSKSNRTVGLGFNMDAGEKRGGRKTWEGLGIDQDFDAVYDGKEALSEENNRKLAKGKYDDSVASSKARAEELGVEWESLKPWHQAMIVDVAYNTGKVNQWERLFTATTPLEVVKESRRKHNGEHTAGMDNRVAKLALMRGIVSSPSELKSVLPEMNLKTDEVVTLIKNRKAQPTREA